MRRCRELLPVFAETAVAPEVEVQGGADAAPTGVRLQWDSQWLVCWFLPLAETGGAWQIHQVQSSRFGTLSRYDVQQAYKMLRVEAYPDAAGGRAGAGLYWLQQTVNGLSLGCVYALIAIGYTLVYGITGVINFAYGPLYTVGAFVLVACWAGTAIGLAVPLVLLLGTAGGAVTGAAFGWSMDRTLFRPLRAAQRTVPLIAAIGLAVALQEWIRLSQGPRTRYVLVAERTTWPLFEAQGFTLYVSLGHVLVGAGTAVVGGMLWWLHRRSRFGRMQRAVAQDQGMARLARLRALEQLGVEPGRRRLAGLGVVAVDEVVARVRDVVAEVVPDEGVVARGRVGDRRVTFCGRAQRVGEGHQVGVVEGQRDVADDLAVAHHR